MTRAGTRWSARTKRWRASDRPRRRAAARDSAVGRATAPAAAAMTHAWLFTGPPGSGRSVAARAFAAALQCERRRRPGLRRVLPAATPSLAGSHPDVHSVVPEGLSISVAEMRAVVARRGPPAGARPLAGRGDRGRRPAHRAGVQRAAQGGRGAAARAPCSCSARRPPIPTTSSVTIRSRCRLVTLRTPPAGAVAAVLRRATASTRTPPQWAAQAVAGPCRPGPPAGPRRARPATRRAAVLAIPASLTLAAGLPGRGRPSGRARPRPRRRRCRPSSDAGETEALQIALGAGGTGKGAAAATRGTRRRDPGSGAAAEVAGHPDPARRPRPGAGRPGRVLPRRAAGAGRCADVARRASRLRRRRAGGGARGRPARRAAPPRRGARLPRGARAQRQAAHRRRGHDGRAAPAADAAAGPRPGSAAYGWRALGMVCAVVFQRHGRLYYADPGELTAAGRRPGAYPTDARARGRRGACGRRSGSARTSAGCRSWPAWPAPADLERAALSRKKRAAARVAAKRLIREHELPMKVVGVDYVASQPGPRSTSPRRTGSTSARWSAIWSRP